MGKTNLVLLWGMSLLVGCSSQDSTSETAGPALENGQTGSPGYVCEEDACDAKAQTWVEDLGVVPPAVTFTETRCRPPNTGPADAESLPVQHCQCIQGDGTVWPIPAGNAGGGGPYLPEPSSGGAGGEGGAAPESVVSTEPCAVFGRGHLACVLPTSAVPGCSESVAGSCDVACAALERGFAEDAQREYVAEIRYSECLPQSPGDNPRYGRCTIIASINGSCYVTTSTGFFAPTPYDCSMSDEEIFAARD